MNSWPRVQKLAAVVVGSSIGVAGYLYLRKDRENFVFSSWTSNTIVRPEVKWDFNWDQ